MAQAPSAAFTISPRPTATFSAIPQATTTAGPSPAPTLTQTPTPEPVPEIETLNAEQAGQVCLDNQLRVWPEGEITGPPRVEERTVLPRWLVAIPAENENGPYTVFCLIHEDPTRPENEAVANLSKSL